MKIEVQCHARGELYGRSFHFYMPIVPRVGDSIEIDEEGTVLDVTHVTWRPTASPMVAYLVAK